MKFIRCFMSVLILAMGALQAKDEKIMDAVIDSYEVKNLRPKQALLLLLKKISKHKEIYPLIEIHERPVITDSSKNAINFTLKKAPLRVILDTLTQKSRWSYRISLDEKGKVTSIDIYMYMKED